MIVKKIDITSKMGLQLSIEEDLFIVKLYEESLSGHKENVVYKCKVSDSSMEEMIGHINKTHKMIMQQQ